MVDKPTSGELFGIPYNFDRPSITRMVSSYWQPGKGMLVKKPFGVGYTLNLASWRSWIVLAIAGVLLWHQEKKPAEDSAERDGEDGPVQVLVDGDSD